jgi:hypothetical protein
MHQLVCKNCGYAWQYKGDKKRTSCSKCKTSITIIPPNTVDEQLKQIIDDKKAKDVNMKVIGELLQQQVKFPLSLWRDVRFKQRIDHAPSLGEDHIVLKVDNDGILFL